MAKMRWFLTLILFVLSIQGFSDESVSNSNKFIGAWLEAYPGQEYEPDRARYLTIQQVGALFLLIDTSTRRPGGAVVLRMDGQQLVSLAGGVTYSISTDSPDVLFAKFAFQGAEGPRILRFIRYSESDLKILSGAR